MLDELAFDHAGTGTWVKEQTRHQCKYVSLLPSKDDQ
jgi:hypothetical protein